jgi:CO/xanthine dehydrogenase FAD-binding subunit
MSINPHPELPEFDYIRPATLAEASRFLADHAGQARPLSGGTDIFVRLRDGHYHDRYLVDIKKLDGANVLHIDPGGNGYAQPGLVIGAGINMNQVMLSKEVQECYPLLAEACRSVASFQLRSRATIVGNICNASPAGDTIGVCLLLGGVLKVHGLDGFRSEPLATFFKGPGKTVLQPGDIVTELYLPLPPANSQGAYLKLNRNNYSDLSIVGVTVMGYPDAAAASRYSFRIALASVAPTPLVAQAAQDYLSSHAPGPESIKEAAKLAAEAATPIDDVRGTARYRKSMVRRLTEKGLTTTWERLSR